MRDFWRDAVMIISLVVAGLVVGFGIGYQAAQDALPDCQEDEFLYPVEDYTGPGDNAPGDYVCVHVDEIREGR